MSETTTTTSQPSPAAVPGEPAGRRPRLRLPGRRADAASGAGGRHGARGGGRGGGRDPLLRNAYALMLNTGVSAVLGLGYWLVAARYYSPEAVGQGSAAIAAMKFLAGITAVTLTGALARFIPVSGRRTGRMVATTYLASSAVVALAAMVFLLTLRLWGPSYHFLHGPLPGLAFVGSVVAWSVMTLQDGVLTGLRSAVWVPVGNTVFSTGKLVLLVVLATTVPVTGVFVSWVAAVALSVLPLGWLVFRRLVPRHVAATEGRAQPPTRREIGRFLAGDYTGSLFSLAVVYLVPVIVASQISSRQNAYFYITSTIGSTVDLLAINMGASLTVEGAHDPSRIADNLRAALRRMARIMIPICMFLAVFAPYVLRVFGPGYASQGAPLLRFMVTATLTRVLFEAYFGVLRAQSRTSLVALLQGALCVLVLGSTLALLRPLGIVGAGVAELCSQCVIAAIACVGLVRILRASPAAKEREQAAEEGELAAPEVRTDDTLVLGTGRARSGIDQDTLALGVRLDFEHQERRPYVPAEAGAERAAAPATPNGTREPKPPKEPKPRVPLRAWLPEAGGWAVLLAALALYWLPLRGMDDASLDRMNGLGLISVLPHATLAGAALLVVAFCWGLGLRTPRRWLLLAALLATVVSLHAVPALLEAQPRFATAWQHAGFVEYIDRTGQTRPYLDARWSWPGFFAGVALVTKACGITDLTQVLRWWPLAVELLYLAPLMLLLRAVRASWRAKWCAAWLFVLCGWVGQDYFSPQSLNVFFYLVFVAVLLVWFRSPSGDPGGRRLPGEEPVPAIGREERGVLLGVLLAVFVASVVSHQLTPFVMLGVVASLVIWKRCALRGLPLLCGVLVTGWVGFLGEAYWSGHFNELFGGLGSLGGNVTSSVSGRIKGGDDLHHVVLYARVLLAAGTLALGGFGWLRRRRVGIGDRSLLILSLVPFLGFGMQSYGGEMALRVFLFASPGAAVLAAFAFFPRVPAASGRPWLGTLAALVAGQVLIFGFLLARWGNEGFERVRSGEVAAMDWVYGHDAPTARVLWPTEDTVDDVTPNLPWSARDMDKVVYRGVLAPVDPARVTGLVQDLRASGPQSYLMITTGTAQYLVQNAGYPADWQREVVGALAADPQVREVMSNRDAAVFAMATPPAGAVPQPAIGGIGPVVTWTPWTVVGAVAGVLLALVLAAREVARVLVPARRRMRAMSVSFRVSLVLLAVFLAALADRFVTLS
ncbi:lipopolysaccharide biosynthesis protein [Streptomyces sp. PTM05]|uniref:Lipopolysaccharide biosynthesis protein n=1 Tax=Streptantibioticus parmotrematis TaxID=2873249 RepID=A0ABS7QN41_9ACTN|nr:lipopolysaccharide biosynthesis protein [Streptantibioticus parmotrematis]MBY8884607.1 lipopolysaccharide biosynthesis protein [Streptantibioticus parmotrematis]